MFSDPRKSEIEVKNLITMEFVMSKQLMILLVLMLYVPVNNFSVMSGH